MPNIDMNLSDIGAEITNFMKAIIAYITDIIAAIYKFLCVSKNIGNYTSTTTEESGEAA